MAAPGEDLAIQKLYEFSDNLNQAKKDEADYAGIIKEVSSGGIKVKQLAAQLIPRFFKYFPQLSGDAINAQLDLCEEDELKIRVQAIRGLPLLCKDTPQHLPKITDVLAQLLVGEDALEQDAVKQALMSVLRQDIKVSLATLFKHITGGENAARNEETREKVLHFIKERVFPSRLELLQPQAEMERFVTDLVKQSMHEASPEELELFLNFLEKLSIFGDKADPAQVQELLQVVETQVDFGTKVQAGGEDAHLDKLEACLKHSLPLFVRGGSNSRFLNFYNNNILPVFDKLSQDKKLSTLKYIAEMSPHSSAQDARHLLPQIVNLFKAIIPLKKGAEDEKMFPLAEAVLFTFHNLANKTPNATNALCGYKFVTGQTSDRLGEDFTEQANAFQERLVVLEGMAKAFSSKLNIDMAALKAPEGAKDDAAKAELAAKKQKATNTLKSCNNIVKLVLPLKTGKAPQSLQPKFEGAKPGFVLSWKEPPKLPTSPAAAMAAAAAAKAKRPAGSQTNGGAIVDPKKRKIGGTGSVPQGGLVNRALQGIQGGGGSQGFSTGRGGGYRSGRGSGRGRGYRW